MQTGMTWNFFTVSLGCCSHLTKSVMLVAQMLVSLLYGGIQIAT
jgi:hypothetical protein